MRYIYQSIYNYAGRWGNFILQQTVDDGVIAFTVAVELSYLTEDEQYELHAVMDWSMSNRTINKNIRTVFIFALKYKLFTM